MLAFRNHASHGFSIVELLTVMMIAAILAATAIPYGLSYIRHYQMTAAGQAVASLMQQSRAQAVKRNSRNGLILNFDYPAEGQLQYTTVDADPETLAYDDTYPGPGPSAVFDPNDRDYGIAPPVGNNTNPPHGMVVSLAQDIVFDETDGEYNALLFRSNGSVEAVNAQDSGNALVRTDGIDWVVTIRNERYGFVSDIRVSRNGRVEVEVVPQ
ncbi:MAG TPA: prepilin-type N-terminal cleavage/methylation domain-containing protein [Vicinamibacteria bacterium]